MSLSTGQALPTGATSNEMSTAARIQGDASQDRAIQLFSLYFQQQETIASLIDQGWLPPETQT